MGIISLNNQMFLNLAVGGNIHIHPLLPITELLPTIEFFPIVDMTLTALV
jgi:hypothetical protein